VDGDREGDREVDGDGVGETELKLINILNEYRHAGLSDMNDIVVVCPY
jgi:hypothetical protein